MNIKKNFLYIILLATVNNSLFGIEVKNNSIWNIKYKFAEAGDNRSQIIAEEKILRPGQTIEIDSSQPFSIRRSGTGSSYVSYWHQIPVMDIWRRDIGRSPSSYSNTYKETLFIESGLTGGWSFRITAQR